MRTVLLVDDEQQTITVFETALAAGGYAVIVAQNGQKALEFVKHEKFDLILLDEMMPDMSGNDVMRIIKQDEATRDIPVAILTNFSDGELVREAMNLGAVGYFLKYQISPIELTSKINKLLDAKDQAQNENKS